jgi:hypothetical protein
MIRRWRLVAGIIFVVECLVLIAIVMSSVTMITVPPTADVHPLPANLTDDTPERASVFGVNPRDFPTLTRHELELRRQQKRPPSEPLTDHELLMRLACAHASGHEAVEIGCPE